MTKLLLVLAVLASSIFLLTQFITVNFFDDGDNNPVTIHQQLNYRASKATTDLLDSVRSLIKTCALVKVQCTLVDQNILKDFIIQERKHRENGIHNHRECNYFCGASLQRHVTFLIKSSDLTAGTTSYQQFIQHLSTFFEVREDRNYDQREITIEQRYGKKNWITNHLYLQRRTAHAYIHVVFSHPRLKYQWTYTCNTHLVNNNLFRNHLRKSSYCKHQKLFKSLETTRIVIDGCELSVPKYLPLYIKEIETVNFLPCYFDNARRYLSSYGLDSSWESEIFRSKATHLLSIAVDVLKELDVPFWLSSGTCLGWFRQCDFISHSKDVDIGIFIKDYKEGIIPAFQSQGMSLKHVFGKVEDSFELSFQLEDMKLDIFFFYEDITGMWNGGTQARTGKKFKYLFEKFDLCWTSFSNLMVRVPCQTEHYVRANYGDSWNVVVKTWDWKASPPNVRGNGEWPVDERGKVIQVFSV